MRSLAWRIFSLHDGTSRSVRRYASRSCSTTLTPRPMREPWPLEPVLLSESKGRSEKRNLSFLSPFTVNKKYHQNAQNQRNKIYQQELTTILLPTRRPFVNCRTG